MPKYFLDTEFIEDGKIIDLISIALVCEDGREYYAISTEFNPCNANDWVRENVLKHLPGAPARSKIFRYMGFSERSDRLLCWTPRVINMGDPSVSPNEKEQAMLWKTRDAIAADILEFCDPKTHGKPEFIAYYADYDWVVFCWLFGTMMQLPEGFPMYCIDIKQECDLLGDPPLPEVKNEHNALDDARWNKVAWEFLDEERKEREAWG